MIKSRYDDNLHEIPKNYWVSSYAGATISTCNIQDPFLHIYVRFIFAKFKLLWDDAD